MRFDCLLSHAPSYSATFQASHSRLQADESFWYRQRFVLTPKFLPNSLNCSRNTSKFLGQIQDQGSRASFFRYLRLGTTRAHFWPELRCQFYSLGSTSLAWSVLGPNRDLGTFRKTNANLQRFGLVTWFEMQITSLVYRCYPWFFVGAYYVESGLWWQILAENKCTCHFNLVY